MKKTIVLMVLISLAMLTGCKKQTSPDSIYLWKPKTKEARYLKAEYIQDLRGVIKSLGEYGLDIQEKGVGFTTHYNCSLEGCSEEENAQNWLYVVVEEGVINNMIAKTYDARAAYTMNRKFEDVMFALKKDFIIKPSSKIDGVLIGLVWGEKDKVVEMIDKPRFESLDIYIDIETFRAYQNRKMKYTQLLDKAVFVKSEKDKKEIIFSPL